MSLVMLSLVIVRYKKPCMVTVGRKLTRSRRSVQGKVCAQVQVQTPGTNILNIGELWPGPASTGRSVWEERRLICTAWERREERGNLYSYDKSDPQRQQQPGPGQVTDRWWSVVRAEQSSILGSGSSRGKYSDCGPAY